MFTSAAVLYFRKPKDKTNKITSDNTTGRQRTDKKKSTFNAPYEAAAGSSSRKVKAGVGAAKRRNSQSKTRAPTATAAAATMVAVEAAANSQATS